MFTGFGFSKSKNNNNGGGAAPQAVAFDAASSSASASAEASRTWSHTCTGSNLKLFVAVAIHGTGSVGSGNGDAADVTGITYNGVALTKYNEQKDDGGSGFDFQTVDLWYLDAPATGAHNVVVSVSPNSTMACGAISFTGAAAGAPADGTGGNQGAGSTDFSNTIEGVPSTAYGAVAALAIAPATSATAGGDLTEKVDEDGAALGSLCWMGIATGVAGDLDTAVTFAEGGYAALAVRVDPA